MRSGAVRHDTTVVADAATTDGPPVDRWTHDDVEGPVTDTQILLLLLPVIVIEIGLIIFALRDLLRPERTVRGESKLMWGLIICFISLVGPILYLTVGRHEE
jgi:hypothetical protein